MSRLRREFVACPQCGKKADVTIWETLNAEINPKENKQLLDGTLFRFACECGYTVDIDSAMLYHNMTHRAMVYYVSEECVEKTKEIFNDFRKESLSQMEGYTYRIVTGQNALREKAILIEMDLDDRVIELCKRLYCDNICKQHPGEEIEETLFSTEDGKWQLQFLGSVSMTAELTIDFYEKIKNQYAERLSKEAEEELVIDSQWAMRFLGKKEN